MRYLCGHCGHDITVLYCPCQRMQVSQQATLTCSTSGAAFKPLSWLDDPSPYSNNPPICSGSIPSGVGLCGVPGVGGFATVYQSGSPTGLIAGFYPGANVLGTNVMGPPAPEPDIAEKEQPPAERKIKWREFL